MAPFSLLAFARGFIVRFVIYGWLAVVVTWAGIFDFLAEYISRRTFIYSSVVGLALISIVLTLTRTDVTAFWAVVRKRYARWGLGAALIGVWLVILIVWYCAVDGYQDVEEAFIYHFLLFFMALPGSLLVVGLELVADFAGFPIGGGLDLRFLSEIRILTVEIWARYFLVFLIQLYLAKRWLLKKLDSERRMR